MGVRKIRDAKVFFFVFLFSFFYWKQRKQKQKRSLLAENLTDVEVQAAAAAVEAGVLHIQVVARADPHVLPAGHQGRRNLRLQVRGRHSVHVAVQAARVDRPRVAGFGHTTARGAQEELDLFEGLAGEHLVQVADDLVRPRVQVPRVVRVVLLHHVHDESPLLRGEVAEEPATTRPRVESVVRQHRVVLVAPLELVVHRGEKPGQMVNGRHGWIDGVL